MFQYARNSKFTPSINDRVSCIVPTGAQAVRRIRLYSIFLLTVFGLSQAAAEGNRHYWSIDNSLGVTLGYARELVYQYTGSKDLLSELVWPLEGLVYYGTALDYNYGALRNTGIYTNLAVRFGFYMPSGTITDKDWLNGDANGYFLTNFSAHDAISENTQWVDATVGYGLPLADVLIIRAGLTGAIMNLHWTARDGYIQYGPNTGDDYDTFIPWDSSFPKVATYGTGMAYWQNWVSLAPVLEVLWQATPRLSLRGGTSIYILNSCSDQDDHYLRLLQFTEIMAGGLGFEPRLSAVYGLTNTLVLGFEASWRYISGLRGNTKIMEIGSGYSEGPYADIAGTDYSVARCAFTVSARY